jgi:hypothetical protein
MCDSVPPALRSSLFRLPRGRRSRLDSNFSTPHGLPIKVGFRTNGLLIICKLNETVAMVATTYLRLIFGQEELADTGHIVSSEQFSNLVLSRLLIGEVRQASNKETPKFIHFARRAKRRTDFNYPIPFIKTFKFFNSSFTLLGSSKVNEAVVVIAWNILLRFRR